MLLLLLRGIRAREDRDYFQIKEATREISLSDGTYYKEVVKFSIQILDEEAPLVFYHAIPHNFWGKVSYTSAKNIRTGQLLTTTIVRRDELHADLFYIQIDLDALPTIDQRLTLLVEYHVAQGGHFLNKFTSLFSDGWDSHKAAIHDRKLQVNFSANIPGIYDISNEQTTVKFPKGSEKAYSTPFSPVSDSKPDTLELGPNQYLDGMQYEEITVNYTANVPTLMVSSRRSVYVSGLPVRIGAFNNQLGRVSVLDELNFTNTDPRPSGLRESRLAIYKLRQQPARFVHDITLTIPKAENIRVFDRVGKVASVRIVHGDNSTTLTIEPRHELFGQERGQIMVKYDAVLVKESDDLYGLLTSAAPKMAGVVFYDTLESCVYPPSSVHTPESKFYSAFPLQFDRPATAGKTLDIESRAGRCFGRGLSSDLYGQRTIGATFRLDREKMMQRFIAVAACIATAVLAVFIIRLIL